MIFVPPSPMDMCSLAAAKNWIGITSSAQDANLQECITAASIYFLRMTGRGPRNWQTTTKNPFNEPVDYNETYDGVSGQKLFIRNFPINSVSSLTLNGIAVPAAQNVNTPGFVIDSQGRSIVLSLGGPMSPDSFQYVSIYGNGYTAGAGAFRNPRPFGVGAQQINVQYNAGFNTIPVVGDIETVVMGWQANTVYTTGQIISDGTYLQQATNSGTSGALPPAFSQTASQTVEDGTSTPPLVWVNIGISAPPYTITVQSNRNVLSDQGVFYFSNGVALVKVNTAPAVGEYMLVAPGYYLFNAADQGVQMLLDYTLAGTPSDIILAIQQLCSLNYVRRNWIGVRSIAMKDVGSTSYTLKIDPGIQAVIDSYTRSSIGGN